MEEVLEGRTEVTHEDLEKLQYTEQVIEMHILYVYMCPNASLVPRLPVFFVVV